MSSPLDIAVWLACQGMHVFPLRPGSKKPFGNCRRCSREQCTRGHCPCLTSDPPCHGLLAATSDLAQIARWWSSAPRANIGINAGRSGLVVLDLDRKDKPPASAAPDVPTVVSDGLAAWEAILAAEGVGWPDTLTVTTPSDGLHLYYRCPPDLRVSSDATGRVGHQIDIRADDGYVLAPGCEITAPPEDTFGAYTRVSATVEIAALPDWLCRRVTPPPARPAAAVKAPNLAAVRAGEHAPGYWQRIWDDELSKVENHDGERWRLVYNAARRLANLATHDTAPWTELDAIDALVAAAIRRRQRSGKPTEEAAARRNATRGWNRGTQDGPDSLLGWGNAA